MRWSFAVAVALAAAPVCACGGTDEVEGDLVVDARAEPADAAAPDATPGVSCASGGAASVTFDLGGDSEPMTFGAAWWNTGHVTKSCFEISVALSATDVLPDPYYGAAGVLEVWFPTAPVLGENTVQLHLHAPDTYLGGTVTLTTLSDTAVEGTIDATSGSTTATGAFAAVRCQAIYDPCI
jgi:hypothetical protein